jgi:hypothetical protein
MSSLKSKLLVLLGVEVQAPEGTPCLPVLPGEAAPRVDAFKSLPPLCNGAQTGLQCRHYWAMVHGVVGLRGAPRPDGSPDSRVATRRVCTAPGTSPEDDDGLGPVGAYQARACNRYEPHPGRPYWQQFEEMLDENGARVVYKPAQGKDVNAEMILAGVVRQMRPAPSAGEAPRQAPPTGVSRPVEDPRARAAADLVASLQEDDPEIEATRLALKRAAAERSKQQDNNHEPTKEE